MRIITVAIFALTISSILTGQIRLLKNTPSKNSKSHKSMFGSFDDFDLFEDSVSPSIVPEYDLEYTVEPLEEIGTSDLNWMTAPISLLTDVRKDNLKEQYLYFIQGFTSSIGLTDSFKEEVIEQLKIGEFQVSEGHSAQTTQEQLPTLLAEFRNAYGFEETQTVSIQKEIEVCANDFTLDYSLEYAVSQEYNGYFILTHCKDKANIEVFWNKIVFSAERPDRKQVREYKDSTGVDRVEKLVLKTVFDAAFAKLTA